MRKQILIAGGGLAGVEAANQASMLGVESIIYEMRPVKNTPAHETPGLAELVCSNSLKSDSPENASGILKREMASLNSLVLEAAEFSRVPAGKALAVDRKVFSEYITSRIESNSLIEVVREEFDTIPDEPDSPVIIATGPLTSDKLSAEIGRLTDSEHLYFYDSISPVIDADSLDMDKLFKASRYDEISEGDYLNSPLDREQYYSLVREIAAGQKIQLHEFEKEIYFESCMPVEVICERGAETLRFGPMKPVGLIDPRTGRRPYAVLQLRVENRGATMYNMVGFQTKLRYPEQRRIFRTIPGLENADFLRYGSIHRNTYINSPKLLNSSLQMKTNRKIYFAGQITGVEGYVESAAMGIIAGINASRDIMGIEPVVPGRSTAIGSLISYITDSPSRKFQPMNINFGLFPLPEVKKNRELKRKIIAENSMRDINLFKSLL